MPSEDDYRAQAEALLRLAAAADNMRDRGRLIDEAMQWHSRAIAAQNAVAEDRLDSQLYDPVIYDTVIYDDEPDVSHRRA